MTANTLYRRLMSLAHEIRRSVQAECGYAEAMRVGMLAAWAQERAMSDESKSEQKVEQAATEPSDGKFEVNVTSNSRMSNSGFHRCGGNGSGVARWWLRDETQGCFVEIPWQRGDKHYDADVRLSPGKYVLGVGRGKDAIRERFEVDEDGDVIE